MTDPERLSQRSTGLAAELLRAAAGERPSDVGMEQTLLALGFSGAVLGGASATAAAAVGGAKLTSAVSAGAGAGGVSLASAGTLKATTATLVIKWLGIGVLGGVGVASVAAVASGPSAPPNVVHQATPFLPPTPRAHGAIAAPARLQPGPPASESAAPETVIPAAPSAPRIGGVESRSSQPALDMSVPLAAEVAYVDRARALLVSGQSSQGLALLESYEQRFSVARLLPEVLFLQLEAYERSARSAEARRAAQRLVDGFPNSPHAGRARRLLGQ